MPAQPPKSTKSAKSAQTRQRILDAAASVLAVKGYAGTRMADIAEVADYPAPAMYYYFGSREELVNEVLLLGIRRTREFVEQALDNLPGDTPPDERIRAAVEAHLKIAVGNLDYARAATRNMAQLPADVRGHQLKERALYGDLWRELLEAARASGDISANLDLGVARMYVLGALNWLPEWWKPDSSSIESTARTITLLTCSGLFGPTPDAGDD